MVELTWMFPKRPKLATEHWEWPAAIYAGPAMRHAAYIICEDQYDDVLSRNGMHRPLNVVILRYNYPGQNPLTPRRMLYRDTQFTRLHHAIGWTQVFIDQHREWQPTLI